MVCVLLCGCAESPRPAETVEPGGVRLQLGEEQAHYQLEALALYSDEINIVGERTEGGGRQLDLFVKLPEKAELSKLLGESLVVTRRAAHGDASSYILFPQDAEQPRLVKGGLLVLARIEGGQVEADLMVELEEGVLQGTLRGPLRKEAHHGETDPKPDGDRSGGQQTQTDP